VNDDHPYDYQGPLAEVDNQVSAEFGAFIVMHHAIHDKYVHQQLQDDLVEHLWARRGKTA
jgi:hypothetical protein